MESSIINYIEDEHIEDGTLLSKIYVPIVSEDMTISSMWNIFTGIGPVKDIVLKKTQYAMYAIVTFVNSTDAAKALKWQVLGGISAKHQPTATTKENKNNNNESKKSRYVIKNAKISLLELNDDCLLNICSYLNVFTLINLETVCTRFSYLVKSIYNNLYRIVDFNQITSDNATPMIENRFVLKRIGKYINELRITGSNFYENEPIIELIPEYCENLNVIRFKRLGNFSRRKTLFKYLLIFKHLKILSLNECKVSDLIVKCFEVADSLVKLDLKDSLVEGYFLTKIKNLQHLNIHSGQMIQPNYFNKFSINNKTLRYLDIADCVLLNGETIENISKNLTNIEHLSIGSDYKLCNANKLSQLATLPRLKKIHLLGSVLRKSNYFDYLLKGLVIRDALEFIEIFCMPKSKYAFNLLKGFSRLREIIIREHDMTDTDLIDIVSRGILRRLTIINCNYITDKGVLKCIKMCPNLKYLDVYNCKQVNNKMIASCLPDKLRNRKSLTKLTFAVSQLDINYLEAYPSLIYENKNLYKIVNRNLKKHKEW